MPAQAQALVLAQALVAVQVLALVLALWTLAEEEEVLFSLLWIMLSVPLSKPNTN